MPRTAGLFLTLHGRRHCCCSARTHSAGAVAAAQLEEPKPSMHLLVWQPWGLKLETCPTQPNPTAVSTGSQGRTIIPRILCPRHVPINVHSGRPARPSMGLCQARSGRARHGRARQAAGPCLPSPPCLPDGLGMACRAGLESTAFLAGQAGPRPASAGEGREVEAHQRAPTAAAARRRP